MKKLTLSIAIASFVAVPFSAFAGSPTYDAANAGTHGANLGTNSNTTAQQVLKTLKDYGLDQVAYMLAQKLGQKMATATINKTTGGASSDKDPNYIQDFTQLMQDIEEQQKDLWTTKLLTSSNPYARNISAAMIKSPMGDVLPEFTLSKVIDPGTNWKDVANDLSLAGENSLYYYSQLAFPENTPVGAQMIADESLAQAITTKKTSESMKISSPGFLPNTQCNVKIADYKNSVSRFTQNVGQANQNSNQMFNNNVESSLIETGGGDVLDNTYPSDWNDEDPVITEGVNTQNQQAVQNLQNQNAVLGAENNKLYMESGGIAEGLAADTAGCIEEMIKNPVATTQVLTNEAGKFGMDMTKNIQGWGQIVAGLFVSLFNGFVNQGLSSLKADYGQVKKASNVGGPEQLNTRDAEGNISQNTNFASSPTSIVDLRNDFQASMEKTQENLDAMESVRKELLKVPAKLATLDICLPGPDYIGLPTRMGKYYDQQSARLMKRSMMGDDDYRNGYQTQILNFIERDYDIAKAETTRDMNDDTRNIPGAGVIRNMLNTFQSKKNALNTMNDSIQKANEAMTRMRQVGTDLKSSVSFLKTVEPGFASLPGLVFTTDEWNALPAASQDAIYNWLKQNSGIEQVDDPNLSDVENKGNYAIASSWGLWEYPFRFLPGNKWSDDVDGVSQAETQFLAQKNNIRATFGAIKDSIPTDWEISKNTQLLTGFVNDNKETDRLIHDCDMVRILAVGDNGTNTSAAENAQKLSYSSDQEFLAKIVAGADTYFQSEQFKGSLTLPNILTAPRTWAEDGCIPNAQFNQLYQANIPTGQNYADHGGYAGGDYTCMGDFGYLYGATPVQNSNTSNYSFDEWIDRSSNAYQTQTHINGIGDYYGWRWPSRRFTVDTAAFGTGWTITDLKTLPSQDDGGYARPLFCRLNSVLKAYGKFSGSPSDWTGHNFYCSSKWADTSISEAIGMFIVNSLQ